MKRLLLVVALVLGSSAVAGQESEGCRDLNDLRTLAKADYANIISSPNKYMTLLETGREQVTRVLRSAPEFDAQDEALMRAYIQVAEANDRVRKISDLLKDPGQTPHRLVVEGQQELGTAWMLLWLELGYAIGCSGS